jgi:hypothetical protein
MIYKSQKTQKLISITLVLVMLILTLPPYKKVGAEDSPHRIVFIEGYFEYWQNPDGWAACICHQLTTDKSDKMV